MSEKTKKGSSGKSGILVAGNWEDGIEVVKGILKPENYRLEVVSSSDIKSALNGKDVSLVILALEDIFNAQSSHTFGHNSGRACRDDGNLDPRVFKHHQSMPVTHMEYFIFIAALAKDKSAIGQYPIDIEYYQFDLFCLFNHIIHGFRQLWHAIDHAY